MGTDKRISEELNSFYDTISDTNRKLNKTELSYHQARLDTLASVATKSEYWGIYLIQSWIHYRNSDFDNALKSLNNSFKEKDEEYIEGKNLERLIESERIKRTNLLKKFGRYPYVAIGLTIILAIVSSGLLFFIFLLSALGNLIYFLIIDKWNLGHKEVIAKICIFLVFFVTVIMINGALHGAFDETQQTTNKSTSGVRR